VVLCASLNKNGMLNDLLSVPFCVSQDVVVWFKRGDNCKNMHKNGGLC
jgi:hypothetical protein